MILSFQGSRILDGDEVIEIIEKEIKRHNPEYIVTSGEADGVCRLAREYCRRNGIPLKLHYLQIKKYARGAYHYRSLAVIKESDYVIFIHDGRSKGTKNELEIAKKLKKPYTYYKVEDTRIDDIDMFLNENEWNMDDSHLI